MSGEQVPTVDELDAKRLRRIIRDVAGGDGYTVQFGNALVVQCDTFGYTKWHDEIARLAHGRSEMEAKLHALAAEWKALAADEESPSQRTLSEAADDLRKVLSGDWPYRACPKGCADHVAHCLHCGRGMNPGDAMCCPQEQS